MHWDLVWVLHACMERGGTTDTTNYGGNTCDTRIQPGFSRRTTRVFVLLCFLA
jgi:hypothetical protein